MAYTKQQLRDIYWKTDGFCKCCRTRIVYNNYGRRGEARGRWEVAHETARAVGGSSDSSNLFAMCLSCNRKMGIKHAKKYCGY
jgi:5-methylcytosine-specific restriction endonuclease McrA